jgi:insulysin
MSQVQLLKTPIKSEGDKKDYRLIKLPNGVKALLIRKKVEDNEKEKANEDMAAACVTINVGSFDDPRKAMGLAHFLEHMVRIIEKVVFILRSQT